MRRALLAVVALGVARAFTTKRAVTRPRGVASMSATAAALVIGVDVGSGSARAGVFRAADGAMLASAARPITTWNPEPEFYEQSSEDIWRAVCAAVKAAVAQSGADPDEIVGLGFDATCSLVALDASGAPVSVSKSATGAGEEVRDVVLWMDHRAERQAMAINAGGHAALRSVGGVISPEMEMPKICWLRDELPGFWESAGQLFDLADYLTWRATGGDCTRSLCTLVCKWQLSADAHSASWDRDFLQSLGLSLDADGKLDGRVSIGSEFAAPGEPLAPLCERAANDLGLPPGRATVGVGMIDAHAGGVGCVGAGVENNAQIESRLALIAGTSACHMASSFERPVFATGVWGPYYSAMVPGSFLNEGGQSAAGKLLDFVTESHAAWPELEKLALAGGVSRYVVLNERLGELARSRGASTAAFLARDLHVDPDFYGNRAPLADPSRRGAVAGLTLSATLDDLATLYLATLQALAYQTRHILEVLVAAGHVPFESVVVTGGLSKNALYVATHADALGLEVALPAESEAVLLGAAVLGATAARQYASLAKAMAAMTSTKALVRPGEGLAADEQRRLRAFHDAKYAVFRKLVADHDSYRALMADH